MSKQRAKVNIRRSITSCPGTSRRTHVVERDVRQEEQHGGQQPVAGLVPAAGAWVLLLRRLWIVLDLTQHHLTAVRDDRIYRRRWRYAFADVARVIVSRDQPRKQPIVTFPVTLVMREG